MANLRLPLGLSILALVIAVAALVFSITTPWVPEAPPGPTPASLPTLSTGNQWVYEFSVGECTYNLTMNVTGQDVDCYTLDLTFDPSTSCFPLSSGDLWLEKDTLLQKKWKMSGTDGIHNYTVEVRYSYDFDEALWPLEVGKEVRMTRNFNLTITENTTVVDTYSETINGTTKVEGKENKPVIAGEFDCFYVVFVDESEIVRARMWYSDQVKSWVKLVYYDEIVPWGNTRYELKSYSV